MRVCVHWSRKMGGEKPPPVASSEFFDNLPVPSSNPTFFGLRVNLSGLPKVKNGAVLSTSQSDKLKLSRV